MESFVFANGGFDVGCGGSFVFVGGWVDVSHGSGFEFAYCGWQLNAELLLIVCRIDGAMWSSSLLLLKRSWDFYGRILWSMDVVDFALCIVRNDLLRGLYKGLSVCDG